VTPPPASSSEPTQAARGSTSTPASENTLAAARSDVKLLTPWEEFAALRSETWREIEYLREAECQRRVAEAQASQRTEGLEHRLRLCVEDAEAVRRETGTHAARLDALERAVSFDQEGLSTLKRRVQKVSEDFRKGLSSMEQGLQEQDNKHDKRHEAVLAAARHSDRTLADELLLKMAELNEKLGANMQTLEDELTSELRRAVGFLGSSGGSAVLRQAAPVPADAPVPSYEQAAAGLAAARQELAAEFGVALQSLQGEISRGLSEVRAASAEALQGSLRPEAAVCREGCSEAQAAQQEATRGLRETARLREELRACVGHVDAEAASAQQMHRFLDHASREASAAMEMASQGRTEASAISEEARAACREASRCREWLQRFQEQSEASSSSGARGPGASQSEESEERAVRPGARCTGSSGAPPRRWRGERSEDAALGLSAEDSREQEQRPGRSGGEEDLRDRLRPSMAPVVERSSRGQESESRAHVSSRDRDSLISELEQKLEAARDLLRDDLERLGEQLWDQLELKCASQDQHSVQELERHLALESRLEAASSDTAQLAQQFWAHAEQCSMASRAGDPIGDPFRDPRLLCEIDERLHTAEEESSSEVTRIRAEVGDRSRQMNELREELCGMQLQLSSQRSELCHLEELCVAGPQEGFQSSLAALEARLRDDQSNVLQLESQLESQLEALGGEAKRLGRCVESQGSELVGVRRAVAELADDVMRAQGSADAAFAQASQAPEREPHRAPESQGDAVSVGHDVHVESALAELSIRLSSAEEHCKSASMETQRQCRAWVDGALRKLEDLALRTRERLSAFAVELREQPLGLEEGLATLRRRLDELEELGRATRCAVAEVEGRLGEHSLVAESELIPEVRPQRRRSEATAERSSSHAEGRRRRREQRAVETSVAKAEHPVNSVDPVEPVEPEAEAEESPQPPWRSRAAPLSPRSTVNPKAPALERESNARRTAWQSAPQ